MKSTGKPAAITMCIGPPGDGNRVPPGECAVRLAKAGAVEFALYQTYSRLLFEHFKVNFFLYIPCFS